MPPSRTGEQLFHTTIAGAEKGRVFIRLPFDPVEVWGARSRYHVAGSIGGRDFRGVVEESGLGHILALGPAWRRDRGLRPGDEVAVVLALEGPQREGLAADIAAALAAEPEAADFFDSIAQFYRNGYLRWIDATRRSPATRAERIAEFVKLLKAGCKERPR
ncbi:MAG: YdeI/OmpD-associated family protein [Longimicrobiales bacterium]